MKRMVTIVLCLFASACSTSLKPDSLVANDFKVVTGQIRRAVIAGLTAVDPDQYRGWHGECPGCDVDADTFALLCRENGVQVSLHHNEQATLKSLERACREAWVGMGKDDLFVFFISGHGGQVADNSGDEDDAKDETLCLWDGAVSDDYLRGLWEDVPEGVRIFFVTDTCNSGTNYKSRSFKETLPDNFKGSLLHFGGCGDGLSSFGDPSGGIFTTAMVDGWNAEFTYLQWFSAMITYAPRNQVFVMAEFGKSFKDRTVLE